MRAFNCPLLHFWLHLDNKINRNCGVVNIRGRQTIEQKFRGKLRHRLKKLKCSRKIVFSLDWSGVFLSYNVSKIEIVFDHLGEQLHLLRVLHLWWNKVSPLPYVYSPFCRCPLASRYATVRCPSVCLSRHRQPVDHSDVQLVCCWARARLADIDRSITAAGARA